MKKFFASQCVVAIKDIGQEIKHKGKRRCRPAQTLDFDIRNDTPCSHEPTCPQINCKIALPHFSLLMGDLGNRRMPCGIFITGMICPGPSSCSILFVFWSAGTNCCYPFPGYTAFPK